jgi:hypothetical protein
VGVVDLADGVFVGLVGLLLLFVGHALGGVRAYSSIVSGWGAEIRDSGLGEVWARNLALRCISLGL